jgi:hypothetical protein
LRKKPMIIQYGHTLSSKSKLKADLQSWTVLLVLYWRTGHHACKLNQWIQKLNIYTFK